jgi:hypothetical protein
VALADALPLGIAEIHDESFWDFWELFGDFALCASDGQNAIIG